MNFLTDNVQHFSCTQCLEDFDTLEEFMDHQLDSGCTTDPKLAINKNLNNTSIFENHEQNFIDEQEEADDDFFDQYKK